MKGLVWSCLMVAVLQAQTPAKKDTDAFFEQRKQLQSQARAALDREMGREKTQDCGGTTLDMNNCLAAAVQTATATYQAYAGALRAMLAQKSPWPEDLNAGPTGVPLTQAEKLAAFDQAQAAWDTYRDAMCTGVAGLVKSGTAWRSYDYTCRLKVLDDHMRELSATYGEFLSR